MDKLLNFNIIKTIFLGAFVLITLAGCDEEENFEPKLFLETESIAASNATGDYTVDFVTNLAWEASSDVDWITFEQGGGDKGKLTLAFTVLENNDDERTGTVTLTTTDDLSSSFQVVQEAGNRDDIYVKVGGTGEGFSWSEATSLDQALALAVSGNTIHIAAGTYVPAVMVTGGDREEDKTFEVSKNITLKGGYPADASSGAEADPAQHKTILFGEGNAYHVLTVTAPKINGQKVVIDGLTISGGHGNDRSSRITINDVGFSRGNGAGMVIGNSVVDIIDTDIVDNTSDVGYAPGLFIFGGSEVTIKRCKVNRNISGSNGGGLWVDRSVAYIYDSEFNENEGGTAPGVHGYPDTQIYMYNSEVVNNKGRSYGAGFYIRDNTTAVLVNCLISGNTSTSSNGGGGVMMYDNNSATIINCTITDNVINGPGGGVYRRLGTNVLNIYNSIISGNEQKDAGPDVDVYEIDAEAPVIQASVLGATAYNHSGGEIAGATFDANTMLSAEYVPIGDNNPALDYGMTSNELNDLGSALDPVVGADIISVDIATNGRAGLTTMGAIVK